MEWFLFALLAQVIGGTSIVFDKLLFKRFWKSAFEYSFWLGILGISAVILIPFGAHLSIPFSDIWVALLAGILFVGAMFFFFSAIFRGETSSEAVLIAALSPIFTLAASSILFKTSLDTVRFFAFALLIGGGIILFFVERRSVRLKTALYAVISALFFGLSYSLTKDVFNHVGFLSGFVWIKTGGAIAAILALAVKPWRLRIFHSVKTPTAKKSVFYIANRLYAGLGSIILYYATSLGPVPLVNATENIKYVFVFIGGWLLLKERLKGWTLVGKISAFVVIALGIITLGSAEYYASHLPNPSRPIAWGVTFSQEYATQIGLDWKENFDAVMNQLRPQKIRLIAYWDMIEPKDGEFYFNDLDYQINSAIQHNTEIILAVGQRVPRWPECHLPSWTQPLTQNQLKQKLLDYEARVLNRYKDDSSIQYVQIENEPFLIFGDCPPLNLQTFKDEINQAKTIVSQPILVTDGGEFGTWYQAASVGDIFGTTMYRRVHTQLFGYIDYHLPPEYFRMKSALIHFLTGKTNQRFIVTELGAEPWMTQYPTDVPVTEQFKFFDVDFFKSSIAYARGSGFDEYYLWGAEWWYWMKTKQNHPEFWNYAKEVLNQRN